MADGPPTWDQIVAAMPPMTKESADAITEVLRATHEVLELAELRAERDTLVSSLASATRPMEPCPLCSVPLTTTGAGTICCAACGWTMRSALARGCFHDHCLQCGSECEVIRMCKSGCSTS